MPENQVVQAEVRYLHSRFRGSEERAEIGSRETRRANTAVHDVSIHDARPIAAEDRLGFDRTGFVLSEFAPGFEGHRDPEKCETEYYPAVRAHMRELTGAAHVVIQSHLVRTEDASSFDQAYARFVHCDYPLRNPLRTTRYALRELGFQIDPEQHDFAWFNLWQPFDNVAERNPLALIDTSTLEEGDLVDYFYCARGFKALSTMPVHNPAHRFYYVPKMQLDEALVFKQLDTRDGGRVACPHTSFDHPDTPEASQPRRSIEVRLICAFPKGQSHQN